MNNDMETTIRTLNDMETTIFSSGKSDGNQGSL